MVSTDASAQEDASEWTLEGRLGNPWPAVVTRRNDTASHGRDNSFGSSLAISGETLVVGVGRAQLSEIASTQDGGSDPYAHPERVVVYERTANGWSQGLLLQAPAANRPVAGCAGSGSAPDCFEFGRAVAIDVADGNTIVVGAPAEHHVASQGTRAKNGAVYVFERAGVGWSMAARLVSPNPQANDRFGASVSVHGGTIVVGSEGDRATADPNIQNGAAYVFTRTNGTWSATPSATLRSPVNPLPTGASFGQNVAVWGDTIAIGDVAPKAAHIFRRLGSNWDLETTLTGVFDQKGHAIALREDVIVAGSEWPGFDLNAGDAFVATRTGSTWSTSTSLASRLPIDVARPAWFGGAVAIDDDLVAVGTGRGTGTVMLFQLTDVGPVFLEEAGMPPASTFNTRQYGSSLGLSGHLLVIGAPSDCNSSPPACDEEERYQAGSVFTFVNPTRAATGPEDEDTVVVTTPPPATGSPWVPTPANEQPRKAAAAGEMQREGGQPVALRAMSTTAGTVAYVDEDATMSVVFTGDRATSVERGLVATRDGMVRCEICAAIAEGTLVEIWAFSTPRLVATAVADASGCIDVMIPLSAPLDGGPAIGAGQHTLQVILPMDDGGGRLAINVGVTVGLRPGSLPAGEGVSTGAAPMGGLLAVTLVGLLALLRRRGQGLAGSG
jgi:hypothetical protein